MQDIQPPNKKPTRLEKLQQKLYSPSEHVGLKNRKELKPEEYIPNENNWDDENIGTVLENYEPKKGFNFFALFAVIAFIFFIGAAGYGFLKFYSGGPTVSGNDVDISVIGPVSIGGGEDLTIDVIVQNNNQVAMRLVDIIIEYPEGTKSVEDLRTDLPRIRDGIGDIEPNTIVKRSYSAALFGVEGDTKELQVRVEYSLPDSNAIFEKEKPFEIVLQSSPIRLVVNTVDEITANQELTFDIELTSNSNQALKDVILEIDYPFGFELTNADRETYVGDNKWYFESLKPKETQKIKLVGRLLGQDNEERVFKFNAGLVDENNPEDMGIVFTNLPKSVVISRPFFEIKLALDGDTSANIVKESNQLIQSQLTYVNNTSTTIEDAEIILTFNGEVLDESTVSVSEGFYRSSDNSIVWNKSTTSQLDEIPAGRTGTFSFNMRSLPLSSGVRVFRNPEITINAIASGKRIAEQNVPTEIESNLFKRIQFPSEVNLNGSISHTDGPLPPKVDNETVYTITLNLTNSSNNLENARVTADLPTYVRWNNVSRPASETISYDPVTRVVEWRLDEIDAHAGFTGPLRTVSFDVTLVPSTSQLGQAPRLVRNIRFTGLDTFISRNINSSMSDINTDLGTSDYGFQADEVVE